MRFRVALALLSAVLFWFSFGLTPFWAAAWLAPIPVLVAAYYSSWLEAALLTWLAAGIGLSSNFTYYLKTTGPVATVVLLLLQILAWGFMVVRVRAVVVKSRSWVVVFAFPLTLAALNTLVAAFSPHGTWGSYAYTQMDALPVIQIASVVGAAGIVFVTALFASVVSVAIYRRRDISRPLLAYGLPVLLVAAGILFGDWRLKTADPEPTVRVGLASVDDFIGPRMPKALNEAVWQRYAGIVKSLAQQGAQIVVLPEKISQLADSEMDWRQAQLATWSRENRVYLLAGVQLNRPARKDNALWVFSPDLGLLTEYHKQHMVPHLEADLEPGHEDSVRVLDGGRFGLAICRDLLFTDLGRHYGQLGVQAMLVPVWDFYRDAWMASSVAAMRGVESGYSVVRAGRESYLNVSDRYGRTIARKRSENMPGSMLLVDLPLGPVTPTLYARCGNWFGWSCLALALLLYIKVGSGQTISASSAKHQPRAVGSASV